MRKWERRLKPFLSEARQKKASGHKIWQELEEGLISQGALEELKRTAVEELIRAGAPATVNGTTIDLAEDLGDGLCEAYYNLKKYSLGLSWCEHALERNTDSIPAILLMAEVEIEAERYENAGRILSDAQRLHNPRINSRLREVRQMIYRSQHKDYYKILGVNQDASERDIKSAHRNKSREFHPDKYQGDLDPDKVMDKMAEINEAYEVLSDEETRRQYDAAQVAGANHGHPAFGGGHHGQFAGFDFGAFQNQFQQHFMKQHRQ
jgi:DnaJ family protein C protein 3